MSDKTTAQGIAMLVLKHQISARDDSNPAVDLVIHSCSTKLLQRTYAGVTGWQLMITLMGYDSP